MRRGWAAAWCWPSGTAAGAVVVSRGGGGALVQLCGAGWLVHGSVVHAGFLHSVLATRGQRVWS